MGKTIVIIHDDEFLTTEIVEVPEGFNEAEFAQTRAEMHRENGQ